MANLYPQTQENLSQLKYAFDLVDASGVVELVGDWRIENGLQKELQLAPLGKPVKGDGKERFPCSALFKNSKVTCLLVACSQQKHPNRAKEPQLESEVPTTNMRGLQAGLHYCPEHARSRREIPQARGSGWSSTTVATPLSPETTA